MNCPNIKSEEQSIKRGSQRTKKAVNKLGIDVMIKIYSFTLYSLGYSYEYISKITKTSKPDIKRVVNEIMNSGIIGFYDKRKKTVNLLNKAIHSKSTSTIENNIDFIDYDEKHFSFKMSGQFDIKINKEDVQTKKNLALLMLESGLLEHQKVTEILNCHRNTVS